MNDSESTKNVIELVFQHLDLIRDGLVNEYDKKIFGLLTSLSIYYRTEALPYSAASTKQFNNLAFDLLKLGLEFRTGYLAEKTESFICWKTAIQYTAYCFSQAEPASLFFSVLTTIADAETQLAFLMKKGLIDQKTVQNVVAEKETLTLLDAQYQLIEILEQPSNALDKPSLTKAASHYLACRLSSLFSEITNIEKVSEQLAEYMSSLPLSYLLQLSFDFYNSNLSKLPSDFDFSTRSKNVALLFDNEIIEQFARLEALFERFDCPVQPLFLMLLQENSSKSSSFNSAQSLLANSTSSSNDPTSLLKVLVKPWLLKTDSPESFTAFDEIYSLLEKTPAQLLNKYLLLELLSRWLDKFSQHESLKKRLVLITEAVLKHYFVDSQKTTPDLPVEFIRKMASLNDISLVVQLIRLSAEPKTSELVALAVNQVSEPTNQFELGLVKAHYLRQLVRQAWLAEWKLGVGEKLVVKINKELQQLPETFALLQKVCEPSGWQWVASKEWFELNTLQPMPSLLSAQTLVVLKQQIETQANQEQAAEVARLDEAKKVKTPPARPTPKLDKSELKQLKKQAKKTQSPHVAPVNSSKAIASTPAKLAAISSHNPSGSKQEQEVAKGMSTSLHSGGHTQAGSSSSSITPVPKAKNFTPAQPFSKKETSGSASSAVERTAVSKKDDIVYQLPKKKDKQADDKPVEPVSKAPEHRRHTTYQEDPYFCTAKDSLDMMDSLCKKLPAGHSLLTMQKTEDKATKALLLKIKWGLMYNLMRFHHALWKLQSEPLRLELTKLMDSETAKTIRHHIRHGYFIRTHDGQLCRYAEALVKSSYAFFHPATSDLNPLQLLDSFYTEVKPFFIVSPEVITGHEKNSSQLTMEIEQYLTVFFLLWEHKYLDKWEHDGELHSAMKMLINNLGINLKLLQTHHKNDYNKLTKKWSEHLETKEHLSMIGLMKEANKIVHHFDEQGENEKGFQLNVQARGEYVYEEISPGHLKIIANVIKKLHSALLPESKDRISKIDSDNLSVFQASTSSDSIAIEPSISPSEIAQPKASGCWQHHSLNKKPDETKTDSAECVAPAIETSKSVKANIAIVKPQQNLSSSSSSFWAKFASEEKQKKDKVLSTVPEKPRFK